MSSKKVYYLFYLLRYFVENFFFIFFSSRKIIGSSQSFTLIINFFYNYLLTNLILNFKYRNLKKEFKNNIKKNYKFSNDWFTNNLPIWIYIFKTKSLNLKKILEIGSFEGMSLVFLLSHFQNASIDCVETFEGSDEHNTINFLEVKKNFDFNMKFYQKRFHLYHMSSDKFFIQNKNKLYDLIYIDGSHFGYQVYKDAINSFDILNIGGLLVFDDFLKKYYKKKNENVIGGVCNFIKMFNNKIKVIFVGYQIFIKKIDH